MEIGAHQRRENILWVTVACTLLLIVVVVAVSFLIWNRDYRIAFVPVDILEWAFIGGVIGVLYRLTYVGVGDTGSIELYAWAIAKPVIGTVMGGIVYFLAVSGELFLNGQTQVKNTQFLCVLAFLGGFSDRFSIELINRIAAESISRERKPSTEPPAP